MKIVRVLAPLLLILLLSTAARAQGQVAVEVDAGYDGYYSRTAGPTPVRVRITNPADSFRARVEIESVLEGGKVVYYTDIDLPQGSQKAVTLYPAHSGFNVNAHVRVFDGKRLVAEATDKLTTVEPGARLYGALSPDLAGYAGLADRAAGREAVVARLTPETLPDRADALSALGTIIVDGAPTASLSDAQKAALRAWVEFGGRLIIAGGADAAQNVGGLGDLAPVIPGATQNAGDLSALAGPAGVKSIPQGGTINVARPAQGATVDARSGQTPLIVSRRTGLGAVTWLAWSPSTEAFRRWEGTLPLLRNLGASSATSSTFASRFGFNSWPLTQFLQNVAGGQLPSTLLVAGFLLIYTLIIGPGLYIILRRRDRREMAWLLVPLVTVLFAGLAYGANFLVRGTGTSVRILDVVDTHASSDTQRVTTYASLFSPGRRKYDIAMPQGYSVVGQPGDPFSGGGFGGPVVVNGNGAPDINAELLYRVETGSETVLRDVQADIYSFKQWTANHVQTGQGPILGANLSSNGAGISGQITNRSDVALEDARAIYGNKMYKLGTVAPGETREVQGAGEDIFGGFGMEFDGGPGDERENLLQQTLSSSFGPDGQHPESDPNEVLVIGWQKPGASPVRVLNARADQNYERLVVLHAPYSLKSGQVTIPLSPAQANSSDDGASTNLSFRLPTGLTAQTMKLAVRAPQGFFEGRGGVMIGDEGFAVPTPVGPPTDPASATPPPAPVTIPELGVTIRRVEVQDPKTQAWTAVRIENTGSQASGDIPSAARHVGPDGTVSIRVFSDGFLEPSFYELTVSGRKQ